MRKNLNLKTYERLSKVVEIDDPMLELCKTIVYKRGTTIKKDSGHRSRDVKDCLKQNKFTPEQSEKLKEMVYRLYNEDTECVK